MDSQKSALVVSPVMTHGFGQGNSARIVAFSDLFRDAGYSLTLFHVQTEGKTPNIASQLMKEYWDVYIPTSWWPYSAQINKSGPFSIDDWIDEANIKIYVDLLERYDFDVVIINYVWMSRYAEIAKSWKPGCVTLIDTHDKFGDRDIHLLRSGLLPGWYYTTLTEERIGLNRADIVVGIQPDETVYFNSLCASTVICVRHLSEVKPLISTQSRDYNNRVGYIGSQNVWNMRSMVAFKAECNEKFGMEWPFRLVLAGPISTKSEFVHPSITLMGFVGDTSEFYSNIDFSINPMIGGTGLKIKTVESLLNGLPIISTNDGSGGIPTDSVFLKCDSLSDLIDLTSYVANSRAMFQILKNDCNVASVNYKIEVNLEIIELFKVIDSHR